MLQINNKTNINNINYLRFMERKNSENGKSKNQLESERATPYKENKKQKFYS